MFTNPNRRITNERIDRFRAWLLREERAPATVEKYLHDLRAFAAWLGGAPVHKESVAAWKTALVSQGLTPSTVNGKLAALHSFFACMGWPDCRVKFLRIQRCVFRSKGKDLSRAEYERLLAAAERQHKPQLALLMETICATGVRVSEVRYITVEAVRQGYAQISLKGKIRTILLPGKLCRKLKKFAKERKIQSGPLFLGADRKPLSRCLIWAQMKRLCKAAGVEPGKVFPHNLRHLFARTYYKVCKDIVQLADVLGHSSIETTRIYLVSTGEEHARHLERLGLVS